MSALRRSLPQIKIGLENSSYTLKGCAPIRYYLLHPHDMGNSRYVPRIKKNSVKKHEEKKGFAGELLVKRGREERVRGLNKTSVMARSRLF